MNFPSATDRSVSKTHYGSWQGQLAESNKPAELARSLWLA